MNFNQLHQQNQPLLICNVWDVLSAKVAEQLNFQAIASSSGAIASMLGYEDGEEMTFAELEYIVKRITESTKLPLSIDLEGGYSRNLDEIVRHIERLAIMGIVGINIEDSIVVNGKRSQLDATIFSKSLQAISKQLQQKKIDLYLNIRTDTFLLKQEDALAETIRRAKMYADVGANGLFVPCIEQESDIEKLVAAIDLPLNVMCMPQLPDFDSLQQLGVKRISMGNFVFNKLSKRLSKELQNIQSNSSFQSVFA